MAASTTVLSVREILRLIEGGRFRFPTFQRPFVWSPDQISSFLRNVSSGVPIGPILTIRRPADAEGVRFGPAVIDAPAVPDALFVVDGGQRLTTLALVFLQSSSFAYDVQAEQVVEGRSGELLPFGILTDDEAFLLWQSENAALADRAEPIRERFLGSPVLLTELPGGISAPDIFTRVNTGGTRLGPEDRERARDEDQPPDFPALLDRLRSLHFGRFSDELARTSLAAVGGSVPLAWQALRAAVAWLRDEAGVPHLDVWRHHELLTTSARFFAMNPHPSARARILLRRWLWRSMSRPVTGFFADAITGQDSVDASRLAAAAPASAASPEAYLDAVGDQLALITLGPLSFVTGEPIAVRDVLSAWGRAAFRTISGEPVLSPPSDHDLLPDIEAAAGNPLVLASHALDRETLDALLAGREPEFRERRHRLLVEAFDFSSGRLAAWGAADRPAISALLVSDEEDRR